MTETQRVPHLTVNEDDSAVIQGVCRLFERSGRLAHDGHGHLDRERTLNPDYYDHANADPWAMATTFSLPAKRNAVRYLHEGKAYQDPVDFETRIKRQLDRRIVCGVGRFDTCIDTTPDICLDPFKIVLRLRDEYREKGFKLGVGAYALLGFKDPGENSDRLDVFNEAAEDADFLCGLPERDIEGEDGVKRIGFEGHIRIILERAIELGKPAHFHVDQGNDPVENGTERLINVVRAIGSPVVSGLDGPTVVPGPREPTVWAIHVISPSAYPEDSFWKMVRALKELNIGVICCPRAALSMRQIRSVSGPIHNSIARIPEMLLAGVRVRLASDNISDVFVTTGTGDFVRAEIPAFVDGLRFSICEVLFRLAVGDPLNETDRELVRDALRENYAALETRYDRDRRARELVLPPWTLPPY